MHVLGTPPAFVLSQDQTLNEISLSRIRETDELAWCVFSFQGATLPFEAAQSIYHISHFIVNR
ncbi:hypothetical protein Alches_24080 [Alicyclobacillus hesperidum subsp. aegles]|uniref:Uncharacterized protein n=1 Tax=Alicyclobacillus hesperidum TaxID=89784 RepID=A0AA37X1H6_9BACL|nr:hypothetical protein Alches_18800 [Alicyclobacillus hesperidum subsp. aegles]GLG02367.1 hypothetical protein Alches_24080 [Alicyclobacillus hesperidum subsp. aegles]GLV13686.1 hypothetical protein Heshes_13700 [Alicyclobacillus hesperidum]